MRATIDWAAWVREFGIVPGEPKWTGEEYEISLEASAALRAVGRLAAAADELRAAWDALPPGLRTRALRVEVEAALRAFADEVSE